MTVGALLLALALVPQPGGTPAAESEVVVRVEAFANAFRDGDVATIEGLLAAEYSHCNSDGSRPTREEWLAWFGVRAEEIREGRFIFTEYRNEDVRFQVHGGVVIVTAVNVSAGTRNGEAFSNRLRFTQVWLREDGAWKRIAFHDSRLPDDR